MHKLTGSQERYGKQKMCSSLCMSHTTHLNFISWAMCALMRGRDLSYQFTFTYRGILSLLPLLFPQTQRQKWINKEKGMVFRSNLHHFHSHNEKSRDQGTKDGVPTIFLRRWLEMFVFCSTDTLFLLVIGLCEGVCKGPVSHEYYMKAIVRMLAYFIFQESTGLLLSSWHESYWRRRNLPTLCFCDFRDQTEYHVFYLNVLSFLFQSLFLKQGLI